VSREEAVSRFRQDLLVGLLPFTADDVVRALRGMDLVCWCAPAAPCHGDVLLAVANSDIR
jgi:Domain of unknown function (DUF4326)